MGADNHARAMIACESRRDRTAEPPTRTAAIFDVDGILLASPHEQAWRDALRGFAEPTRLTTALYQAHIAGKPRLVGALAALNALGVADAEAKAPAYADIKQKRLETLIHTGAVLAYPDALRFVAALAALRWKLAVASSSKNATAMMRHICLSGTGSLLDIFAVNVCGRDLPMGKPHPAIFLLAAAELQVEPARCLVIEDAPAGIEAARAGKMAALGVARHNDAALLRAAGADLVVSSLDEVSIEGLASGRLCRHLTETVSKP